MAKVNPGEHAGGERRPALTPAVLDGADGAVLTIKEARTGLPTSDGRKAALLVFKETPLDDEDREYVLWLNATDLRALVEQIGDDDSDWPGERVPIVRIRANNPQTGGLVTKYHIAPAEDWEDLLKSRRGGGKSARAVKRGRKAKARAAK